MKIYLILILTGLFYVGCNNLDDPFSKKNEAPRVLVKSQHDDEYVPGFIDSLKIEKLNYVFEYKIEDEQEDLVGVFTCKNETSTIQADSNQVEVIPSGLGETVITISTTDGFGESSSATVKIFAFDNLPPVAVADILETGEVFSEYERRIDASKSFDRDAKFGGEITKYEYRVDNQATIQKNENFMDYIFSGPGSYLITLRVKDSNETWSETTNIRYTIN